MRSSFGSFIVSISFISFSSFRCLIEEAIARMFCPKGAMLNEGRETAAG